MSAHDSFERCCRLCAQEQDVTIMLFSAEAEAMLLQNKLNQYLLIEIEEDDKLPKNICIKCCAKLQTVCEFIDTARNAQVILLNRSIQYDRIATEKSLKELRQKEIKIEPKSCSDDDETKSLEMEVNVDPMLLLQNSDESNPALNDADDNSCSIEDVTHLHSVDSDNVTIKLIKKGDTGLYSGDDKNNDKFKPFPCPTCKRGFYTELALRNHSWIHNDEDKEMKIFKCTPCSREFIYKNDFINHLKTHKTTRSCQICGRKFRTEKNLNDHLTVHLSSKKSYTCKVCGRSYNTRSNLKTHSITHSNDRPYQCHICTKSFKRNQDLKFHINQHTGLKPYKCPFCEKSFASTGNCYSHRSRMHPGCRVDNKHIKRIIPTRTNSLQSNPAMRPRVVPKTPLTNVKGIFKYQCTLCEHSFMRKDNFNYHMYQHTGEKPFQCSYCPDNFVTRRGLLIHHEKEHPSKTRPLALLSKNVLLK